MTMPSFLGIGTARAGTTSLYNYLKQHPQVYMSPVKELRFFAFAGEKPGFSGPGDEYYFVPDIEAYRAMFEGISDEVAIGEISPLYLYSRKAPERIRRYIPHAKLIAILRNPVERAYSHFLINVRLGAEPLADFAQALREEETRIRDHWAPRYHYKQWGFYHVQLKRYYDAFDSSQIRVYLHEDLTMNPVGLLHDIFQFLGVDETFVPDTSTKHWRSVVPKPKNKALHALLTKPNPIRTVLRLILPAPLRRPIYINVKKLTDGNLDLTKPPLSPQIRKQLIDTYREDTLRLQGLIQRDLSMWLESPK